MKSGGVQRIKAGRIMIFGSSPNVRQVAVPHDWVPSSRSCVEYVERFPSDK
jgi:hypothetical protein